MADQRLPIVNGDDGLWGTLLVQYLTKEHYNDSANTNFAPNGSHKNINIFPGTATAAPITFSSTFTTSGGTTTNAALLSTPVSGAMEYDGNYFYVTQGGARRRVENFTTSTQAGTGYTLANTDTVIFANAASNAVTITLPAASSYAGFRYYIKRIDSSANAVTIAMTGSDTLDGQTSTPLPLQYQAVAVVSNGSAWYIL